LLLLLFLLLLLLRRRRRWQRPWQRPWSLNLSPSPSRQLIAHPVKQLIPRRRHHWVSWSARWMLLNC
jgi:hypothetical protein